MIYIQNSIHIGLVSDGKYGNRAFDNIHERFEVYWILVPEIPETVMLDDPIDIEIPDCDFYISYVRHPDIILQLVELGKPLILGILPGNGLYEQAKSINPHVIHARTMCSLENNTGISEIDEFATYFGKPRYHIKINEELKVLDVDVDRISLCGSSEAGARFIKGKTLNDNNLRDFALAVCHECRAPRFGRTCDKEVAGIIHLLSLYDAIKTTTLSSELKDFFLSIQEEYNSRTS